MARSRLNYSRMAQNDVDKWCDVNELSKIDREARANLDAVIVHLMVEAANDAESLVREKVKKAIGL